jgi:ATP-binding protein involved in chromosome partitioning
MFDFFRKPKGTGAVLTEQQVRDALATVIEPELRRDLVSLNMIRDVKVEGDRAAFTVVLNSPGAPTREQIERECRAALSKLAGVGNVTINWTANVPRDRRVSDQSRLSVGNIIAVASGKGGVGKSTVSTNLAIALAREGARVGLLDADFYGPNIPMMMGARQMPPPMNERIMPTEAHGVKLVSIGFILKPDQPAPWRGPMLHHALRQFFNDVEWGELDYLVVDMPPGTGDVQMSLAQEWPVTGGVIVTTPQDVALADARKGLALFQQFEVPILGIVENMSYFIAPDTGKRYEIFGHGGGKRYAAEMDVPFLGEVPIDPRIAAGGDRGRPLIVAEPDSPAAHTFRELARQVAAKVSMLNLTRRQEGLIGLGDIPVLSS